MNINTSFWVKNLIPNRPIFVLVERTCIETQFCKTLWKLKTGFTYKTGPKTLTILGCILKDFFFLLYGIEPVPSPNWDLMYLRQVYTALAELSIIYCLFTLERYILFNVFLLFTWLGGNFEALFIMIFFNRCLRMHTSHHWASSSLMTLKGKSTDVNWMKLYYFSPEQAPTPLPVHVFHLLMLMNKCLRWFYCNCWCRLLEYVAIGPRFSNIIY